MLQIHVATTRLKPSFRFPASRRVDSESYSCLRSTTARISYPRTVTAPRGYLFVRANEDRASSVVIAAAATTETVTEKGEQKDSRRIERFCGRDEIRGDEITHERDQAKEGEKESKSPEEGPVAKWEPTVEGYLRFLVDSKLVYDTLEGIIEQSNFPSYAGFKNTGLERAEKLGKDLEWFKEQGYEIPEPMATGKTYSEYLKVLAENDPQAFICHFYNIYFAHSAGGRMVGTKVSEKILDNKELEFYKWDGQLSQLLQNVKEKLNKVAELWTREEKNHCLEETEKSFNFSGEVLRLILF